MVAHVTDPARVATQRRVQARDRAPGRGAAARQIVRGWDAGQRARIRASTLRMMEAEYAGHVDDAIRSPEMELIALIDQAGSGIGL